MREILLVHVDLGERAETVRTRWAVLEAFPSIPVTDCTREAGRPGLFSREETQAATILRPNLLAPQWWRGGTLETASRVLPAIIPFEVEEAA